MIFFRPENAKEPIPVIIFDHGSDGSPSAMLTFGAAGPLERGYLFRRHYDQRMNDWRSSVSPK